jgi:signal peptidase I
VRYVYNSGADTLIEKNAVFLELTRETINRGTLLHFKAHGTSMHPFIRNGDIIVNRPFKNTTAKIGDIIFFRRSEEENTYTAHRLIKKDKSGGVTRLLTKGDDLGYYDPPVLPEWVIGKIIQVERDNKRLVLTGWPWRIFGVFIAYFARGRYYNQRRIVRNLGRLWWILGGKRIK